MEYNFKWDPNKAKRNLDKHGIAFELATEVFADPRQMTLFDEEHSASEERWITMGQTQQAILIVVVHPFTEHHNTTTTIRIISARRATKREQLQYETCQ